MHGLAFTKGHGTENDFVLVPDPEGRHDLTPDEVRALADRRDDPAVRAQSGQAAWFMDYRNADGSVSEMCGNGTRVFAAYLLREGLERGGEFAIATRAGRDDCCRSHESIPDCIPARASRPFTISCGV